MVLPLTISNSQTKIQQQASMQKETIRERICDILAGGERAFEGRYKRIHLETKNV